MELFNYFVPNSVEIRLRRRLKNYMNPILFFLFKITNMTAFLALNGITVCHTTNIKGKEKEVHLTLSKGNQIICDIDLQTNFVQFPINIKNS